MTRFMFVSLFAMLACSRGPTTASTSAPAASEPPPPIVSEDATVPPPETIAEPQPSDPPPPADDSAAWQRKDPDGDEKLRAWDKDNLARMLGYWNDLACFRGRILAEGQLAFGAKAGSPPEERYFQFKRKHITELDAWQHALFAAEPPVMEKSLLVGHLIEAHEIVMSNYPSAFTQGDAKELEAVEKWWVVVEAKTKTYVELIGGTWAAPVCAAEPKAKKKPKKKPS